MSTTTVTGPQTNQPPSIASEILNGIYEVVVTATSGALAGYVFSIIDPVGGAIFGATSAFTNALANTLADHFAMDQTATTVHFRAMALILSLGVGFLATMAAGFPVTVLGAVGMICATMVASIVVRNVIGCCVARPSHH